jgi:SOS response regulatory protein OraA/RecX
MLHECLLQTYTIERVIQEFQASGSLYDETWLESYIKTHQKKYGIRFIIDKLRAKGLSSETLQLLGSAMEGSR